VKVVVLGCGFHGRGIAYQLAGSVDVRVLDRDEARAAHVGDKAGVPWETVEVTDGDALRAALRGADAVVNAVGPYHLTALGVIEAALDLGIHYVDMNDDHEVAEAVLLDLSWEERARGAGVTVLLDCGVVPGLSGLLVRHAADQLGAVERVAVRFAWNYSHEYPAALEHFLRINSGEGPQLLDGELVRMEPFAGREDAGFGEPIYFTGIPDPVAIARFLPDVREATAKGAFYQAEANRLLEELIRSGATAPQWPEIPRREVPLVVRVEVEGPAGTLVYEAFDHSRRASTAFTALAALAVVRGELRPGVWTPEAWPSAEVFLRELLADPAVEVRPAVP
jgi:hypothetical protein